MNLIWITTAQPLGGYKMMLTFSDGSKKEFDFSSLLGTHPMYEVWKNPSSFQDYALDGWTVSWNHGRVDVAPEYLYEHGTPIAHTGV